MLKIAGIAAGLEKFEGTENNAKWKLISSGNSIQVAPAAVLEIAYCFARIYR